MMDEKIVEAFCMEYFEANLLGNASWLGKQVWKTPCDLWVYQEILWEVRPAAVVECGTYEGGTAHWLASVLECIGMGYVMSIDVGLHADLPRHWRLTYWQGSSIAPETLAGVQRWISLLSPIMVILDSDHQAEHVAQELELYAPLVTSGSYLIVEDTHINHPWPVPGIERGPAEALADWLPDHPEFVPDSTRERFGLSVCKGGFLRRT